MTHVSAQQQEPAEATMHCMEVCGGHGEASRHYVRPGLDVWTWSQAKQEIEAEGGDLHLISSCASGRITRVLLADVCGFGELFEDVTHRFRELMKRNINSIQQARAVRELNAHLHSVAEQGATASTFLATYFSPTRSYSFCNAGHPTPVRYSVRTKRWTMLQPDAKDVSATDLSDAVLDAAEYQEMSVTLEVGDLVLTCSNTLTECQDPDGQILGMDGVMQALESIDTTDPSRLAQALVDRIRGYHPENLSLRDATILICRVTETPVSWRDNLLAPFRLLGSVSDRTSIE